MSPQTLLDLGGSEKPGRAGRSDSEVTLGVYCSNTIGFPLSLVIIGAVKCVLFWFNRVQVAHELIPLQGKQGDVLRNLDDQLTVSARVDGYRNVGKR